MNHAMVVSLKTNTADLFIINFSPIHEGEYTPDQQEVKQYQY